jgi:hypothetical protein
VYLVWGPLGTGRLREFKASYRQHPPGAEHRLILLMNNVTEPAVAGACEALASETGAELVRLPDPLLDLAAYLEAARWVEAEHLCFLNSYSLPLARDWLAMLAAPLHGGAGLVGASGSYESFSSNAPIVTRAYRRRQFPTFPNAHIRTNAFMLARDLLLDLDWGSIRTKLDTWKLESGHDSITRQVRKRGLDTCVVGRDGHAYGPDRFFESRTFRRGSQPNALIADNRTKEFDEAPPRRRRWLFELAWGKEVVDAD